MLSLRVSALIWSMFQCSKLLSDTSVIQFYPSKFVLIADILDTFGAFPFPLTHHHTTKQVFLTSSLFAGHLVYDRIWTMCSDSRPLPGKGPVACSVIGTCEHAESLSAVKRTTVQVLPNENIADLSRWLPSVFPLSAVWQRLVVSDVHSKHVVSEKLRSRTVQTASTAICFVWIY